MRLHLARKHIAIMSQNKPMMVELPACRTCREIGFPPVGANCPECKRVGGFEVIERNTGQLIPRPSADEHSFDDAQRQARLDALRGLDLRPRFERFEHELRELKKHSHTPVFFPRWPGWVALAAFALASWNAFSSFR